MKADLTNLNGELAKLNLGAVPRRSRCTRLLVLCSRQESANAARQNGSYVNQMAGHSEWAIHSERAGVGRKFFLAPFEEKCRIPV
jgi:hypothetical protein